MAKPARFVYWMMILATDIPKLLRLALLVAGVYFVFDGPWSYGVGCLAILFFWKLNMFQDRLEAVRDNLRGFSDDDMYEAVKRGDIESLKIKGLMQEAVVILRDIRNNQMSASPSGDGGTF